MSNQPKKGHPGLDTRKAIRQELEDWTKDERELNSLLTEAGLYGAVLHLRNASRQPLSRNLEDYLKALWNQGREYRERPFLTYPELVQLITEAFLTPVPPFDEAWRLRYEKERVHQRGYQGWEAVLLRQIVDLHEIEEQGVTGSWDCILSPRGGCWVNTNLFAYLECAEAGCLSRIGRRGAGTSSQGNTREVSWEVLRKLLLAGQSYE